MKKFVIALLFVFVTALGAFATGIGYGYNSHGQYVPTSYSSEKINYGYNSHGQYLPVGIGN